MKSITSRFRRHWTVHTTERAGVGTRTAHHQPPRPLLYRTVLGCNDLVESEAPVGLSVPIAFDLERLASAGEQFESTPTVGVASEKNLES